ncbi:MAG: hypothetical protein AAF098_16970, partial [Pseudomonadota bacterium]
MRNNRESRRPRVAVFVTGQLRNASEHIENWLNTGFSCCEPIFFFTVWDELGHVDASRMYKRALRKLHQKETYVEISDVGIYLSRYAELNHEISQIERQLAGRSKFDVIPYQDSYLKKIDDLEMPDLLAKETHPFWQACVPMAYMNKKSIEDFLASQSRNEFDAYCRLQAETTFLDETNIDWTSISNSNDLIVTSPDTINPDYQLSIKFFAGTLGPFLDLMTAYYPSIDAWKDYKSGTPWKDQPIGERFLKQLANAKGHRVRYSVRTEIRRQRMFPVHPSLASMRAVESNWSSPEIVHASEETIAAMMDWEERNPLTLKPSGLKMLREMVYRQIPLTPGFCAL